MVERVKATFKRGGFLFQAEVMEKRIKSATIRKKNLNQKRSIGCAVVIYL